MGPKEKLRWILRGLATGAGAAAAVVGLPLVAVVGLVGVATTLTALSVDLGKDPWDAETRRRKLGKKQPDHTVPFDDESPTGK